VKLSARNVLRGRVKRIVRGSVNMEVTLQLHGGDGIVAMITLASGDALGLREGCDAYAVIKASSVMVAVE